MDWLIPDFADSDGNLKGVVQSFLIKSGKNNILIDTCIGNGKKTGYQPWDELKSNFLTRLGNICAKDKINIVINTHFHGDHIGWNTVKKNREYVPTFQNAEYVMVKKEFDYIKAGNSDDFNNSVLPVVNCGLVRFVDWKYKIDENVSLFPAPGHTPYHVGIMIKSKNQSAVISGDLFHHPCEITHPEWTTDCEFDKNALINSRLSLLQKLANKNIIFIGSHFARAGKIIKDDYYSLI